MSVIRAACAGRDLLLGALLLVVYRNADAEVAPRRAASGAHTRSNACATHGSSLRPGLGDLLAFLRRRGAQANGNDSGGRIRRIRLDGRSEGAARQPRVVGRASAPIR
jgi:hypothetical protein